MIENNGNTLSGVVPYSTLIGKILAQHRERAGLTQKQLADALRMTQPAYSKHETGDTVMNITQLHQACQVLGVLPSDVLRMAEQYAGNLQSQGIQVVLEKPADYSRAAVAIGVGFLVAALLASRS